LRPALTRRWLFRRNQEEPEIAAHNKHPGSTGCVEFYLKQKRYREALDLLDADLIVPKSPQRAVSEQTHSGIHKALNPD
jgi:hypothetical protein